MATRATEVILDEPASSLNAHRAGQLLAFPERSVETGLSCIMISHMLGEILCHADRIVVMRDGTVVADGPTAIGQNRRATCLAGIDVARIRSLTYVLRGALGGLNGALPAGHFRSASVACDEATVAGERPRSWSSCRSCSTPAYACS